MKLSEKGWRKAVVAGDLLDDPDFEPDDFVDAVVLTKAEALNLLDSLELFNILIDRHGYEETQMSRSANELFRMLRNRFKQAEENV